MPKIIFAFTLLLSISFVFQNCKSSKQIIKPKQSNDELLFINEFKLTYFRQIFLKGFNNINEIHYVLSKDNSGFTELLLLKEDFKLIDSLSTTANEAMIIDSMNGLYRAEGAQGKRPLQYIMDKLQSNWIDSIASVRYNLSRNNGWNRKAILIKGNIK
jgi:hypothetical protein